MTALPRPFRSPAIRLAAGAIFLAVVAAAAVVFRHRLQENPSFPAAAPVTARETHGTGASSQAAGKGGTGAFPKNRIIQNRGAGRKSGSVSGGVPSPPSSVAQMPEMRPPGENFPDSPARRGFDRQTEIPETAAAPQFRPLPPGRFRAGNSGGRETGTEAGPVILEFSDDQQLPAVLAAADPAVSGNTTHASSRRQAAENRIAEDFVAAVTDSASSAAAPDGADPLSPPPVPVPDSREQRWDAAARDADEQYRVLVGQEVYLRKSLEAALLKRQAAFVAGPP